MEWIEKYRNMNVQAKAAIWFVACNLLQKGISFITVPLFTRLLTTQQYGTYSLYTSWLGTLSIFTSLYLYYGVFNNGMTKFEHDRDRYISSMQSLIVVITIFFFILFIIKKDFWSQALGLTPFLIFLMFIEMLVTPALQFWSGRQRFEYKYKRLVIITLIQSLANPVLGIIAVVRTEDKTSARILSVVFVELIICGFIMFYQYMKGKCFFDKIYWKYALKLALPLLPHYLAGAVLCQGDRIMIDKIVGTSQVALYSVAYNIGMLVQIFTGAVGNSFTPWLYQKTKARDFSGIKQTVNVLFLAAGCLIIALTLLSPELVWIFGSEEYANAVYVIPPVAASVYFIFVYNILAFPEFYFEKTKFLMVSSVTAAIVNIILNYIFIGMFGFVAAGYTTLVCYILYACGHYLASRKILNQFLPGEQLFDIKAILLLSLFVVLAGITSNFLFRHWFLRYFILLAGACGTVLKRKEIIKAVKPPK